MPFFDIDTEFVFRGTFRVKAEDRAIAEQYVRDQCGLVMGGHIHSTLPDREVDWDFPTHPEKVIRRTQRTEEN